MEIGVLPLEDPGVFRSLLLPETADALTAGEPVTALALTEDGLALGAAAGYLDRGRFHISSLYVSPDHRRRGGGRRLVEEMERLCSGFCTGMEISFTTTCEEHRTLPPFLTAMGFQDESDRHENIFLTTLGAVAENPFFSGAAARFGTPLSQLSPAARSLVQKAALAAGAPLPEGGLTAPGVDQEASVVALQGSKTQALVVLDHSFPGALTLAAAWSADRDPTVFPALLRSAFARARQRHPPETPLAVQAVGPASAGLAQALLVGATPISHTYLRRFGEEA